MSDQNMEFPSDSRNESSSSDWSPEQHLVSPWDGSRPYKPNEKADKQSIDRVWGRLEEHVVRNREYYAHNRNVPTLNRFSSPEQPLMPNLSERPATFLRSFPWRRLDALAATFFLVLLMGSLLTFAYHAKWPSAQFGSSGKRVFSDAEMCKSLSVGISQITIAEGQKGLEVFPRRVFIRQGGQVTWVNETRSAQFIVNATTNAPATKINMQSKSSLSLKRAEVYTYSVQSVPVSLSPIEAKPIQSLQVVVEVVNIIMILPDKRGIGATFEPPIVKVPQGANLVWLNGTQEKQEIAAADNTQKLQESQMKPFSLEPTSCFVERAVQQGAYDYMLRGSGAKLALFVI